MDQLQRIKHKRLKPEERFLYNIFTNNDKSSYRYDIIYKELRVNADSIWFELRSKYNLNDGNIVFILKKMFKYSTNFDVITVNMYRYATLIN
jgi:hypothetical protein